jgi:3-deoxy-D-manno-octulosonate 8-phosphate phosphatase (KDO 8-P phosphatase)
VNPSVEERARRARLVCFDVDGVFTDGRLYLGDDGAEYKCFHVRDGHGVKELIRAGLTVAVISGRRSAAVERRMAELGVERLVQGCDDKGPALESLMAELGVAAGDVACVGDDLPDLPMLSLAGLALTVADAHPDVIAAADHVTRARGGAGAVREICDLLLAVRRSG